jgi:hypothetical protein
MEEQVLETGGEAEREEHRDSSVDIEKNQQQLDMFSLRFNAPQSMDEDMYKDIRKKFIRER